jgi:cell shape-determining protein MreC
VIYLITLLVTIIVLGFNWVTGLVLAIAIIMNAIYVFDTNCLTTGSCNIWSWVRTIFYVITMALSIWALIAIGTKLKKLNEEEEEEEKRREEDERRREYEDRRREYEDRKKEKEENKNA